MKVIAKLLTPVLFALSLISIGYFCLYSYHNIRIWDNKIPKFTQKIGSTVHQYNPYYDRIPMEEIDFKKLTYLNGWLLYQFPSDREPVFTLSLPRDITYYTRKEGKFVPAFTVEARTEVLAFPHGMLEQYSDMPASGYGIYSWPTYWKGWRYARPFVPKDEYDSDSEDYYYVKLTDLEAFIVYFFENGPQSEYWMKEVEKLPFGWSIWDGAKVYALYVDQGMCMNGFYPSPDLRLPIWTRMHSILALFAFIPTVVFLFVCHKRKPDKMATEK